MQFSTFFKAIAVAASLATIALALPADISRRRLDIEVVRRTDELVELLGRQPSISEIVDATIAARDVSTPILPSLERRLDPVKECPACMEKLIRPKIRVAVSACTNDRGHEMCTPCMYDWVVNQRKTTCPLCRGQMDLQGAAFRECNAEKRAHSPAPSSSRKKRG
ncbi:hypothetical protein C8J56DRAFT_972787 [Mycena floridula]|nr:hypothetical protein C8J56DRAFT_972787 [Mycena floridula]